MHPSMTLGARKPYLNSTEAILSRLDILLNTHPGDLPWKPKFGCQLTDLVGEAATTERVDMTRGNVRRAINVWLTDAKLNNCDVHLITGQGSVIHHREPNVPVAESALVAMGTEAHLEVKLDIEVEDESLEVAAELEL